MTKKRKKKEKYGKPVDVPKGITVHKKKDCKGDYCCIHKPSIHHMNEWPSVFRVDNHWLVERVCIHGVGHPDPDSMAYLITHGHPYIGTHGCDGCCDDAFTTLTAGRRK